MGKKFITIVILFMTLLITTHEPPSDNQSCRGGGECTSREGRIAGLRSSRVMSYQGDSESDRGSAYVSGAKRDPVARRGE